jgi:hypothetical protein
MTPLSDRVGRAPPPSAHPRGGAGAVAGSAGGSTRAPNPRAILVNPCQRGNPVLRHVRPPHPLFSPCPPYASPNRDTLGGRGAGAQRPDRVCKHHPRLPDGQGGRRPAPLAPRLTPCEHASDAENAAPSAVRPVHFFSRFAITRSNPAPPQPRHRSALAPPAHVVLCRAPPASALPPSLLLWFWLLLLLPLLLPLHRQSTGPHGLAGEAKVHLRAHGAGKTARSLPAQRTATQRSRSRVLRYPTTSSRCARPTLWRLVQVVRGYALRVLLCLVDCQNLEGSNSTVRPSPRTPLPTAGTGWRRCVRVRVRAGGGAVQGGSEASGGHPPRGDLQRMDAGGVLVSGRGSPLLGDIPGTLDPPSSPKSVAVAGTLAHVRRGRGLRSRTSTSGRT